MAGENMDWEAIGRSIARGMAAAGNSSSFSPSNPSGGKQTLQDNLNRQQEKAASVKKKQDEQAVKIEKEKQKLSKQSMKLDKQSTSIQKDYDKVIKQSGAFQTAEVRNLRTRYQALSKQIQDTERQLSSGKVSKEEELQLIKKLNKAKKEQIGVAQEATEANKAHSATLGKGALAAGSALLILGNALKNDIMTQLAQGSQIGVGAMQLYTAQLGTSTETVTKMEAENRRAFNAMGGSSEALDGLTANLDFMDQTLVKSVGGWEATTEYYSKSLTSLVNQGIRPSAATFTEMNSQMMDYRRIFGMSAEQFVELNNRLSTNSDIQYQLQGLSKDERRLKMEELRRLVKLNGAMGMSAEQAEKVAVKLAEIGGQKAETRIVEAQRFRAAASALGISGGEEAAAAIMAGNRATEAQKATLQQVATAMANMGADVRGSGGNLQSELMFQTLTGALDLDKYIGKGSEFNTKLLDAAKVNSEVLLDAAGKFGLVNERMDSMTKVVDIAVEAQRAENVLTDKFGQALRSATGALGAFTLAAGAGSVGGLLGSLKNIPGAIGGGAKGILSAVTGAGAAGTIGATAGVGAAGLAGWMAGGAAYNNSETVRDMGQALISIPDRIMSIFGSEEAAERLEYYQKAQAEGIDNLKYNSSEQTAAVKTTNELIAEQNALVRLQVEQAGDAATLSRLAEIDRASPSAPLYGN